VNVADARAFDIRHHMRLHSALMATKEERTAAAKKANEVRWSRKRPRSYSEIAAILGYTRQALYSYRTKKQPWPPGLRKRYLELVRKPNG